MTDGIARMTKEEMEEWMAQIRPPVDPPPYEWQGIASAPKDGHDLDLWVTFSCFGKESGERVANAYWSKRRGEWQYRLGNPIEEDGVRATHWIRIGSPHD